VISYKEINSATVKEFSVIVNATPVGMFPNVSEIPRLSYEGITPLHLCCDLIYDPKETLFLKRCRNQGAMVINGLPMLYAQANWNWIIWEGHLKRLGLL
jgi:shikimate dehydrogenase